MQGCSRRKRDRTAQMRSAMYYLASTCMVAPTPQKCAGSLVGQAPVSFDDMTAQCPRRTMSACAIWFRNDYLRGDPDVWARRFQPRRFVSVRRCATGCGETGRRDGVFPRSPSHAARPPATVSSRVKDKACYTRSPTCSGSTVPNSATMKPAWHLRPKGFRR